MNLIHYAEMNGLDSQAIIDSVCLNLCITSYCNNPSFDYVVCEKNKVNRSNVGYSVYPIAVCLFCFSLLLTNIG